MRKLLIAFSALAAIWTSAPAYAGECKPADEILAFVKQVAPASTVVALTPAQTQAVIAWAKNLFNADLSDKVDVIYLLRDPQLGTALGYGLDGEICGLEDVPGPAIPSLMQAIEGDPA